MKIKALCVCFLLFLSVIPVTFAGKTELTTYYPSAYGEYINLRSSADSYFATASGNVGIGTTSPATKLDVAGGIKSTMWKVTQLYNMQVGPLPLTSASFSTGGGTLLIFASGSGYYVGAGHQNGMSIAVDGVIKGYAKSCSNETTSHKAFTENALVVTGIAAGSHTITLAAWNSTSTNADDFFTVSVSELPF